MVAPGLKIRQPELVWVTVTGMKDDTLTGRVLNQPVGLKSVEKGDEVRLIMPKGGSKHPILATEKYLVERSDWIVHPCDKCGMTELFDAPSDLIRVTFADATKGSPLALTSRCAMCGGTQIIQGKGTTLAPDG
jgi:hypothetical protein